MAFKFTSQSVVIVSKQALGSTVESDRRHVFNFPYVSSKKKTLEWMSCVTIIDSFGVVTLIQVSRETNSMTLRSRTK